MAAPRGGEHAPDADADNGLMAGLDDAELVVQTSPPAADVEGRRAGAARAVLEQLRDGGVLVSSAVPGQLKSDYDRDWFVLVHVTSFLNACGAVPHCGMTLRAYAALLLRRFPTKQFAQNPMLCLDLFNIVQRHEVNTKTSMRAQGQPDLFKSLDNISAGDVDIALDALASGTLQVGCHME